MKKKNTSGISLVALIVTIIVLIILTAAVIVTFMEDGIIDKAKEAVFKNDIRTYQEILIVKKGKEQIDIAIGNGGESELNAIELEDIQRIIPEFKEEYDGLIEIQNGKIVLGSRDEEPYSTWLAELGIGEKAILPIVHNGIIPEGGVYYSNIPDNELGEYWPGDYSGGTKYVAGDKFPESISVGDVYIYGGYEYRYGLSFAYDGDLWLLNEGQDGWGVVVYNSSEYNAVLTTINGKNVVNMDGTFYYSGITEAPVIPETVTSMKGTFYNSNLTQKPIIPNGVTDISYAFYGCTSLINAPIIPNSVTNMKGTFTNCTSLVNAPVIPESVIYMGGASTWENGAFEGCSNLNGIIEINANNLEIYKKSLKGTKIHWITGSISDELKQAIAEDSGIPLYPIVDGGDTSKIGVYYAGVTSNKTGDYTGVTTMYINGAMPETVNTGDVYVEGDYEYRYNMYWYGDSINEIWDVDERYQNGWGVRVLDKTKTSYGEILTYINGKSITSVDGTFAYSNISKSPVIPDTVTSMDYTFECSSLTEAPVIPHGVTYLFATFEYSKLEEFIIPEHVTGIPEAFVGTGLVEIVLHDKIVSIGMAFMDCRNLTTVSVIPESVIEMERAFEGCSNLTGTIEINANIEPSTNPYFPFEGYEGVFNGTTKPITLTGTSPILNEIAAEYSNVTVAQ